MQKINNPFNKLVTAFVVIVGGAILVRIAEELTSALSPTINFYIGRLVSKAPKPPEGNENVERDPNRPNGRQY